MNNKDKEINWETRKDNRLIICDSILKPIRYDVCIENNNKFYKTYCNFMDCYECNRMLNRIIIGRSIKNIKKYQKAKKLNGNIYYNQFNIQVKYNMKRVK